MVLQKLGAYYVGVTNEIYERYNFNRRVQEESESVDSFVAALRTLAKTCNYGTLTDTLIRDRMVVGVRDNSLRKKLLQTSNLTLQSGIDICRSSECTARQIKDMGQQYEDVHSVGKRSQGNRWKLRQRAPTEEGRPPRLPTTITCKFCGKKHEWKKEVCPAWGKRCTKCNRLNHFAGLCNYRQRVNKVDQEYESEAQRDEDYLLTLEEREPVLSMKETTYPRRIYALMTLKDVNVKFQLDCGATVNILPVNLYQDIFQDAQCKNLEKSNTTLVMFNHTELSPIGKFQAVTVNPKNHKQYCLDYVVVEKGFKPLLGTEAIHRLELMSLNTENLMSVDSPQQETLNKADITTRFKDVFSGEGLLEEKLHLEVDTSIPPVKMPVRKVPLSVKGPLKEEIDRLIKLDLLAPVETPTDWISSMVVVQKSNGNIRLCIDPKPLNKALKRNHYPLPVMDDLLPKLSQARVFSVVDAKNGFWHVPLDTDSSYLTTFATPWGRYRWKRMPFGISPAPEEFQRRLDNALEGLEGVVPIFDDILVFGAERTREEAVLDHDKKLTTLLDRCRLRGIKLNKEKLKFRLDKVSFMGHTITSEGLKPDPAKVEAIQRMPAPANKQDVRRLLGTVNYLQKFAPNLSDLTAPLRELLKEANSFQWSEQVEGQCFHQLKDVLSMPPVLKYFDPHQGLELQCDASEKGLGACLMQGGQPLAYASRSLTATEQQYAQIEKEMLAIVFGTEGFEQYVYGRRVKVETDHKPLESILKKSLLSAPKRLQRMMLRLQKFDLDVTYKKGSELYLADTLSRAFLPERTKQEGSVDDILSVDNYRGDAEKEVESIDMLHYLSVTEDTLNLIKQATEEDNRMKTLKTTIRGGWPVTKDMVPEELQEFFPFRDELSLQDGLVFKGERLVIPSGIRHNIMARLHASHIGIQGCLRRARETVYWPGMNKEITEYISKCEICCAYPQDKAKEPLISHEIPTRPREKIGCDMFEFGGRDYLITVDYFSNYFEVDQLSNKTNQEVMGKLKQHLARHGLPDQLISDNGPPYNSRAFQEFATSYGFEHVTSSPGYPQSNGRVENAVKTAKKLMQKAAESKSDPYLSLLDWRNTPSEGLGSSPAQRLFSRRT